MHPITVVQAKGKRVMNEYPLGGNDISDGFQVCLLCTGFIHSQAGYIIQKASQCGKWVTVTIWRLAADIEYRTIAELFWLGCSTVRESMLETCSAISDHLLP